MSFLLPDHSRHAHFPHLNNSQMLYCNSIGLKTSQTMLNTVLQVSTSLQRKRVRVAAPTAEVPNGGLGTKRGYPTGRTRAVRKIVIWTWLTQFYMIHPQSL